MPDWLQTPEYVTDGITFVNPMGMGFTLLMCVLILIVPRKYAWLPVIMLMCYMTMGMRLVIAGMNFTMLRILLFFGWVRVLVRHEFRPFHLTSIDKAFLWWALSSVITYTLLWQTYDAFKNKIGMVYTAVGFFILARMVLRKIEDIVHVVRMAAFFIAPLAISIIVERTTGRNAFAIFSGVPEITMVRMGALRCQGPFAHPILAGTFAATLLPIFIGLWCLGGRNRVFAMLGIVSSVTIVICSASSGPVLATVMVLIGWGMWILRKQMRMVRWSLVAGVTALCIVMKAPIWYVMARMDVVSGSTGYHRAYLLDTAMKHLSEWWLIGTKSTAAWDDMLWDVTNQYLVLGTDGGLITLLLFLVVIALCFRGIGLSVRGLDSRKAELFTWGLGVSLLAHVVSYMSISYFDQNMVNWYMLLAAISTISAPFVLARKRSVMRRRATPSTPEVELPSCTSPLAT